jgi:tail lysozyme
LPIPENAEAIYTALTGAGLSSNAASGILGNIEQESGGDPESPSGGLIQILGQTGGSLAEQITATLNYIKANGSIADINANSPTPEAAALYFSNKYERPDAALANNANRQASATEVASAAASNSWPATGAGANVSAGTSSSILGIPSQITGAFNDLDTILKDILSPAFWLRIASFFAGVGLLIAGIWCLMHASDDSPLLPDMSKLPSVVPV